MGAKFRKPFRMEQLLVSPCSRLENDCSWILPSQIECRCTMTHSQTTVDKGGNDYLASSKPFGFFEGWGFAEIAGLLSQLGVQVFLSIRSKHGVRCSS